MSATRDKATIPFEGLQVDVYQDLSPLTLQRWKTLKPATMFLRDKGIRYRWGHPFRLSFVCNKEVHSIRSLKAEQEILGLDLEDESTSGSRNGEAESRETGPETWRQKSEARQALGDREPGKGSPTSPATEPRRGWRFPECLIVQRQPSSTHIRSRRQKRPGKYNADIGEWALFPR